MEINNYTIYHLHSSLSILDSATDFHDYIDKAKELGMKSIGFSEHGCIYQHLLKKKYTQDKEHNMKYLHGVEVYLTESLEEKIRDNYHTILIAKNFNGYLELNRLVTNSTYKDHFYYKPRISFDEFFNISDNIISISACLASPLNKYKERIIELEEEELSIQESLGYIENSDIMLNKGKEDEFYIEVSNKLKEINKKLKLSNNIYDKLCKKYDYYEIQAHNNEEQKEYNKCLYELSKKHNKPLIMGTDTHSLDSYKAECRIIIKKAKNKDYVYEKEDEFDLTMKSLDELIDMCKVQNCFNMDIYLGAINNTNIMADSVEMYNIDDSYKYPKLYENEEEEFKKFLSKKFKEKLKIINKDKIQEYKIRIEEEGKLFKKQGMFSFMLFMGEMCTWCWENNIPVGYGRGSVTGSLIAYLFDITDVDPIVWNTNLARFCNVERVSLGDIDLDFSPKDRDKVYKYIEDRFGKFKTSRILTNGTCAELGAIIEIGRALKKSIQEVDEIKKTYSENPEEARNKYKDVFVYFDGIKDTTLRTGYHPAGIIASPISLDDNIGLCWNDKEGIWISQCNMKEVDALNFVKFDILGLANIGVIKDTYDLIGSKYLKSHEINWNDQDVYESMQNSGVGIFQMESNFAYNSMKEMKPTSIEDLSMINALIRPACTSLREKALKREFNKNPSEFIDNMFKNSYGYMIYQEQIIEFLQKVCGFTGGEADGIRRCIDEDTFITMGNGDIKKIKHIKVGDIVQSIKNNTYTYNKVNKVFNNGQMDCYKIISEHGNELICTADHEILTQDGYKKLKNISTEDYIITPYKIDSYKDDIPSSYRIEEKDMYLIGMMIGDGSIGSKRGFHFTNSEIVLIEKFKDCVNNRLRSSGECEFIINSQNGVTVDKIYSIYIKSKNYKDSVVGLFDKYGLICKSNEKHIPEEIMNYPIGGKIENLLAGLFNTDGGYNLKSNYIEYYSNSYTLVCQIKNILLKYGIYSYVNKKLVKGYGYYSNSLIIRHPKSLSIFLDKVIPKMVGNKKNQFINIINNNLSNTDKYNFMLPPKYKKELIDASLTSNRSIRGIGISLGCGSNLVLTKNSKITDVKAERIISKLYCPKTYELLLSEYIPLKIKKIEYIGIRNVYDIEVNNTHNYIANNITVHNCIGKKDIERLYNIIPTITDGYCKIANKPREIAEEEVKQYVSVIESAGSYGFSRNHSTPYSMIGYTCAYLRYYYPVEFMTSYLNNMESNEDIVSGTEYCKLTNIEIKNPEYEIFNTKYATKNGVIYKGLGSLKTISDMSINSLSLLKDNIHSNFYDLLKDIKNNTCLKSNQIYALIIIDYFKKFGRTKKLIDFIEYYDLLYNKKQIKKEKVDEFLMSCIKEYKETNCNYVELKYEDILTEVWNNLPDEEIDTNLKIQEQFEYQGYLTLEIPKDVFIFSIDLVSSKNEWCKCVSLKNNKEQWFKFIKKPKKGSIIKFIKDDIEKKKGGGYRKDVYWIKSYEIIKK